MRDTFTISAQKNSDAAAAQEKAATVNEGVANKFQLVGDRLRAWMGSPLTASTHRGGVRKRIVFRPIEAGGQGIGTRHQAIPQSRWFGAESKKPPSLPGAV